MLCSYSFAHTMSYMPSLSNITKLASFIHDNILQLPMRLEDFTCSSAFYILVHLFILCWFKFDIYSPRNATLLPSVLYSNSTIVWNEYLHFNHPDNFLPHSHNFRYSFLRCKCSTLIFILFWIYMFALGRSVTLRTLVSSALHLLMHLQNYHLLPISRASYSIFTYSEIDVFSLHIQNEILSFAQLLIMCLPKIAMLIIEIGFFMKFMFLMSMDWR